MSVVILTESRVWGGLEAHAVSLAETLAAGGLDISIGCIGKETFDLYRNVIGDSVRLHEIAAPQGLGRRSPVAWRKALRSITANAVILQKGTLNTGNLALDLAIRGRFGRYMAIEQLEPPVLPARSSRRYLGGLVPGVGLWWYRWKLKGYLRSIAPGLTVCVSDSVRAQLVGSYGFRPDRITTVRHGVDLKRFAFNADDRKATRAAWNIPEDAFVFGSMRRLVFDKGLDTAIDAFAQTAAAHPARSMYLVIVGEGPERPALEEQARRLGVADRVIFPGFSTTPWRLYPALDVFLLPSRIEALGVVAVEAMAARCEVIASKVGGIPEMIPDPSLGSLVPAAVPEAWAEAMGRAAMRTESDRQALLDRARDHVVRNFDRQKQYELILALLRETSGQPLAEFKQCA